MPHVNRYFALLALAAGGVLAQQPAPPTADAPAAQGDTSAVLPARVEGVATVGDLARVQSQVLLAEAQKKLSDARKGVTDAGVVDEVAESLAGETAGTGRSRRSYAVPVVEGIHGSAANPYALIRISDATVLSVRAGDTLPGGLRVDRITNTGVRVSSPEGERVLGFASAAATDRAASR